MEEREGGRGEEGGRESVRGRGSVESACMVVPMLSGIPVAWLLALGFGSNQSKVPPIAAKVAERHSFTHQTPFHLVV